MYHAKIIKDFEEHGYNVERFLIKAYERNIGHLSTGDKLRLKQQFHITIDERLQIDPTFYTNRDFGKPCSVADRMQINRVALSVINYFKENLL